MATLLAFRVGADDAECLKDEFQYPERELTGGLDSFQCFVKYPNHGFPIEFKMQTEEVQAERHNRSRDIIEKSREKYGTDVHKVYGMVSDFYNQS